MLVQKTYLPCFALEPTRDFYRTLFKRDGVRRGRNEYEFDLGGTLLSCVRQGGHEHRPQPVAIVLETGKLPTPRDIEHAGGQVQSHFPFSVPAGETVVATDPETSCASHWRLTRVRRARHRRRSATG